jgi:hypothetical protein
VLRRDVNKGDYAFGKGDTDDSSKISSVEKRATNEGIDELQDVKEDSVAIEVGVEVDRSTSAGRGGRWWMC